MSPGNQLGSRLSEAKLGRYRYNSPWTQVALVGFVCFCSVGMYSAITNLGAGGTQDIVTSNIANSVLYGIFAVSGFFAGSFNNIFGVRLTLSIGTMGYSMYLGALWYFQVYQDRVLLIIAGGILGFTAALLWAAQGAVMLSYPMDKDKGRSFSLFWTLFNLGGVVGGCITLAIEANKVGSTGAVSTAVYLAFIIIMLTSILTSWLVLPPNYVIRDDGSRVDPSPALPPNAELKSFAALFKDWRMLALFPMFFSSNFFYSYQASIIAYIFNPRGRALASLLTNLGAVFGAIFIGLVLDYTSGSRRRRAVTSLSVIVFLQCAAWGCGILFQRQFTRSPNGQLNMDWSDPKAPGIYLLLFGYYFADAAYQGLAYFIIASISSDSFRLARLTGYYKGLQSAGAACSYGMDARETPYMVELLISFGMVLFSVPFISLVVWKTPQTDEERVGRIRLEGDEGLIEEEYRDNEGEG